MIWLFIGIAVLAASTVGGVLGFGTGALLLPILTIAFGIRVAVPVLGVAMIFASASRAIFSWRDIDWKVVLAYSVAAIPAAIGGAFAFVGVGTRWINVAIAVFVLIVIPARRLEQRAKIMMKLPWFAPLGAVVGVVSGTGGAVGAATTPFYLSYGLVGPAYLGTDGFNSMLVHGSKSIVYWFGGSMRMQDASTGLMLGGIMILGSFLGRRIVERFDMSAYVKVIEVSLIALGCYMLFDSLRMILR